MPAVPGDALRGKSPSTLDLAGSPRKGGAPTPDAAVADAAEQEERFAAACDGNLLLRHLSPAERSELFRKHAKWRSCVTGQPLIKQGAHAKHFFVVDSGEYDVYVKGRQQEAFEHRTRSRARGRAALGSLVHSYTAAAPSGRASAFRPSFGELSLLLGAERAATVVCRANGAVWTIGRLAFLRAVASTDHEELARLAAEQLRADEEWEKEKAARHQAESKAHDGGEGDGGGGGGGSPAPGSGDGDADLGDVELGDWERRTSS